MEPTVREGVKLVPVTHNQVWWRGTVDIPIEMDMMTVLLLDVV